MTPLEMTRNAGIHGLANAVIDVVNYDRHRNTILMPMMGAWFNRREEFEKYLPGELDFFASVAQRNNVINKVLWLPAWAQHFDNPTGNGYYHDDVAINGQESVRCVPHKHDPHAPSDDWRNRLLREAVKANHTLAEYIELFWTDYHIMNVMWDMHLQKGADCTHFCHHPLIMLPLWIKLDKLLNEFPLLRKE